MSARPDINVIRAKYNLAPMGTVDQPTIVSPNFGCDIVEHCQKIFPDSGNLSFDLEGRNFYLDLSRGLQSYYAGVEMPPNWTEEHKRYIQLHMKKYISLYDLLYWHWRDIKEVVRKNGYIFLPQSPSDAVKTILEEDARLEVAKSQDGDTLKNVYKLGKQVEDIDPDCKWKVSTLVRKLYKNLPEDYREIKEIELIVWHCVKQIKPQTRDLKKRIKKVELADKQLFKHWRSESHPSNKVKKC